MTNVFLVILSGINLTEFFISWPSYKIPTLKRGCFSLLVVLGIKSSAAAADVKAIGTDGLFVTFLDCGSEHNIHVITSFNWVRGGAYAPTSALTTAACFFV